MKFTATLTMQKRENELWQEIDMKDIVIVAVPLSLLVMVILKDDGAKTEISGKSNVLNVQVVEL